MVLFVDRATRLIVGIFVRKSEDTGVMKKFLETNLSAQKFSGKDFIFVQSDNREMNYKKLYHKVFFRASLSVAGIISQFFKAEYCKTLMAWN